MKQLLVFILAGGLFFSCAHHTRPNSTNVTSGNPVFPGWYADPEGAIFEKQYWIYPTYSAPYNQQVFLDILQLNIFVEGKRDFFAFEINGRILWIGIHQDRWQ